MDFDEFLQQVLKIKNLPLPGADSHNKMSPLPRVEGLKFNDGKKVNPKRAGVMALFYPDAMQQTRLLLILRKVYEGIHSNQIGLPGGKVEKYDKNLLEAALRETHEEVGVPPSAIKALSEVYIPPSHFMVQPYIGIYPNPKPFIRQESEVETLVEVCVQDFLNV